jgi:hypothetical protein
MEMKDFQKARLKFGEPVEVIYKYAFADREQSHKGYFVGCELMFMKLSNKMPTKTDKLREIYNHQFSKYDDYMGPIQAAIEIGKELERMSAFKPIPIGNVIKIKKIGLEPEIDESIFW